MDGESTKLSFVCVCIKFDFIRISRQISIRD